MQLAFKVENSLNEKLNSISFIAAKVWKPIR